MDIVNVAVLLTALNRSVVPVLLLVRFRHPEPAAVAWYRLITLAIVAASSWRSGLVGHSTLLVPLVLLWGVEVGIAASEWRPGLIRTVWSTRLVVVSTLLLVALLPLILSEFGTNKSAVLTVVVVAGIVQNLLHLTRTHRKSTGDAQPF